MEENKKLDIKIIISEEQLRNIFDQESKRIVGTCLKRFESHINPTDQKAAIKDVLYENLRVLRDMIIINGKEAINLTNTK
jgi:hypothetical protein